MPKAQWERLPRQKWAHLRDRAKDKERNLPGAPNIEHWWGYPVSPHGVQAGTSKTWFQRWIEAYLFPSGLWITQGISSRYRDTSIEIPVKVLRCGSGENLEP